MLSPPPFSPLSWGFSSSALRSLIHGLSMAVPSVSHACTLALLLCRMDLSPPFFPALC